MVPQPPRRRMVGEITTHPAAGECTVRVEGAGEPMVMHIPYDDYLRLRSGGGVVALPASARALRENRAARRARQAQRGS